ncbi:LysR family transcriptional regulator [Sphaerisporangium perillae]|uniref:LysR family transcriptional regulator n=1 Tax=Sphaerisporangium perillae TaxID=2935860 RepID=UPI00200BE06E|nr:LysR family transcriptional regulator [Sphaerisporangium perillae]
MLDVRKLRLLRELARRGTIAAVADALAYTPSAVSQQLAALEREAGVPLLERAGRRVALTPAGATLAQHTEGVLALLEQASAALAATRAGLVGPLRIGAFPTAVRTILPPALVALGHDHPGLELRVTELDPAAVPEALRDGRLDIALVHDYDYVPTEPDPGLDTEPLIEETIYLASAGAHPGADADPIPRAAGEALRIHREAPWIVGTPETLCHTMAIRACQAAGFTPRVRHHADDFTTVLALVAAGQGVALVPELGAIDPPANVTLTPLPSRRRTRIAYRKGTRRHPAISACISAIQTSAHTRQNSHPAKRPPAG